MAEQAQLVTGRIKNMLTTKGTANIGLNIVNDPSDCYSIYDLAKQEMMTVQDFISANPSRAISFAENNYSRWINSLAIAINTNSVNGEKLTRNQTELYKMMIQTAKEDLNMVKAHIKIMGNGASDKAEHLVNALFEQAVNGDTTAARYLIDRVDGRVGAETTLDMDYAHVINDLLHYLFQKQQEVMYSGNGTKMAKCGRRSGKTQLAVITLLISCLSRKNMRGIYIGTTQELTEQLFQAAFDQVVDDLHIRDKGGKRLAWRHLDNGSHILIRGLHSLADMDVVRGFKAEVVVIDEFFHMNSQLLKYFMNEVIRPMMLDYSKTYKLLLQGTPPPVRGTYADDRWTQSECPKFRWTYHDNPYIIDGEKYIEQYCQEEHIDPKSSFILREFEGLDVYDDDFLLFPYPATYDPAYPVDIHPTTCSVGIDYGTSDNTAIIGIAWDSDSNKGYCFYEKKFNMVSSGSMAELQRLKESVKQCWQLAIDCLRLDPVDANRRIYWSADYNGGVQMITQELVRDVTLRYGQTALHLQIQNAHREDSKIMNDKIKDLFRMGCLLLIADGQTHRECILTTLKKDPQGNPTREIDDKTFHPDLLDALRYAMFPLIGLKGVAAVDNSAEISITANGDNRIYKNFDLPVRKFEKLFDMHTGV